MAQLAGDLSKAIMGQTDAEKAFRPWCETKKMHKYFETTDLFIGGIY